MGYIKSNVNDYVPVSFNSLLDNFIKDSFGTTNDKVARFLPAVDVSEDEKGYEINLSIAGVNKEDLKIDLKDRKLTISGERKLNREDNTKKYHTIETRYGAFTRTFNLPENASTETIEAEYTNGVLRVFVPKDENKQRTAQIEIK
jgi:HSP20 family protein